MSESKLSGEGRSKLRLGEALRKWRLVSDRDAKGAAEEIGISLSSYQRIEQGRECDATTFVKLIGWLMGRDGDILSSTPDRLAQIGKNEEGE